MLSKEDVLKIARLARLELSDLEVEGAQKKLAAILSHFESLSEAATEGVSPSFHTVDKMELRADEPQPALAREDLLRNAPEELENCFKIPRVVGGAE